ncbi:MAG: hypothetical protein V4813_10365 [Gemmatimonadota bacterium]
MTRSSHLLRQLAASVLAATCVGTAVHAQAARRAPVAPKASTTDPRYSLRGGWNDAQEAISNLTLLAHRNRPEGFVNPADAGDFAFVNSDLAFDGKYAFIGGYHGFQVWDISTPSNPTLRLAFPCPGGQGDLSVHKNLLFMSVEENKGRVDCGGQGVDASSSSERFRGVRIFDISDIDHPRQVAAVQTCRGSHTHTLLTDAKDAANVYVYVSGTGGVRPGTELAGCSDGQPTADTSTARFRIDVIKVPVAAPQEARIVSRPRLFADARTRAISGLWKGGTHGSGTQETAETDQCHDITVYPELGLAAGACSGNGILLDISDPANPVRIDEVIDSNFSYWHSATFSNDGSKLLFSDEWGGGVGAKCRASDKMTWGANAIFTLRNRKLTPQGHYKIPAAQSDVENCVAHNGTLIPVPGRDIMVQAWYQGGLSVFDFTDPRKPVEIAYFDRGPINPAQLTLAGFWSAYWYNGHIYGSEIGRGLDVLELKPSAMLSQNEIDAARQVTFAGSNPQLQQKLVWAPSFAVARAYLDQLERGRGLAAGLVTSANASLGMAEQQSGAARQATLRALAARLTRSAATARDKARVRALTSTVTGLADASQ